MLRDRCKLTSHLMELAGNMSPGQACKQYHKARPSSLHTFGLQHSHSSSREPHTLFKQADFQRWPARGNQSMRGLTASGLKQVHLMAVRTPRDMLRTLVMSMPWIYLGFACSSYRECSASPKS